MTDSRPAESTAVSDPVVVENGQCEKEESPEQQQPQTDTESRGEGLLESSMRLKPHEAQSYRKKALWVSWVSIVITLILAIVSFTVSIMRHSASAFAFAFDASLDVLSSAIVLWRYSNPACIILGVVFILSSLCIIGKAIHALATKVLPEVDSFLFSVSIVSGLVCTILAVIKFMLGKKLTSRALITDGCWSTWFPGSDKPGTTSALSDEEEG
ncbi:hypothetical protein F7725_008977 [Dissostichus mawsoni]|uniref:Transmembrane protein 163 n=1 Tax=Dissostichus mawsoni TaxID=36200 RepID=A0A7J5Z9V0_DISMA|nr:hypothetical protein F7725_008977 [Dissostichus mawsoni]